MIRWTTAIVVVLLATVAAIVSYRHCFEVVSVYGESGLTARMVPLTVDGLIYASSMVLLDAARRGVKVPRLARWTLGLGILATLAANVAHGLAHGPVGAIVAAWPACALVFSYELLMVLLRRATIGNAPVPISDEVEAVAESDTGVRDTNSVIAESADSVAVPAVTPADLREAVSASTNVEEDHVPVGESSPPDVPEHDPLTREAVKVFFSDVASGEVPPIRSIKSTLNVGQTRAASLQSYLRTLVDA